MNGWATIKAAAMLAALKVAGHEFTLGTDLCQACGVSAHGPAARLRCIGYMAGP
jgi:hypothetical protein